jgi:fatty acid desaturase
VDSNAIVRLIYCNLNFHLEHHLFPAVSRWRLGALARALRPELVRIASEERLPLLIHTGYLSWYRTYLRGRTLYNQSVDPAAFAAVNSQFRDSLIASDVFKA